MRYRRVTWPMRERLPLPLGPHLTRDVTTSKPVPPKLSMIYVWIRRAPQHKPLIPAHGDRQNIDLAVPAEIPITEAWTENGIITRTVTLDSLWILLWPKSTNLLCWRIMLTDIVLSWLSGVPRVSSARGPMLASAPPPPQELAFSTGGKIDKQKPQKNA